MRGWLANALIHNFDSVLSVADTAEIADPLSAKLLILDIGLAGSSSACTSDIQLVLGYLMLSATHFAF